MPVLNETASLLAQSLRETEDQLTRAALNGTASVINCQYGANGRRKLGIAVLKFPLIDLELLAA